MNKNRSLATRLSAIAFASALLFGCGGGGNDPGGGSTAAAASAVVQVFDTASALSVRVAPANTPGTASMVLGQMQYTFAATVSAGADAGLRITGTLMLKTEDEDDGVIEVEGRLLPATTTSTSVAVSADVQAQAQALRAQLEARLDALRTAYKSDIRALVETLRQSFPSGDAGDDKAPLTDAQREAIRRFKDAFTARTNQYQSDVAAATLAVRTQLEALGVMPSRSTQGDDDDEKDGKRGYEVKGTVTVDGRYDLTFKVGDRLVVRAIGQRAADGSISGTFTGPIDGDQGVWSAAPGTVTPPPPPPTPPPPPPASPLQTAVPTCNSCHGGSNVAPASHANRAKTCATCHGPVNNGTGTPSVGMTTTLLGNGTYRLDYGFGAGSTHEDGTLNRGTAP